MINLLIPVSVKSKFFNSDDFLYPQPLIEINDKPVIEAIISNYASLSDDLKFIFVVSDDDCDKFHLDKVLLLLTKGSAEIIKLKKPTKGALISSLMAIDFIDNDIPLIIAHSDQIINADMNQILQYFSKSNYDAGVLSINAVHPRWSYIRTEGLDVIEVSAKNPISNKAVIGFFYFKTGALFVDSAKKSIKRGDSIDDIFYVATALNELILDGYRVGFKDLAKTEVIYLNTPERLKEYADKLNANAAN